MTGIVRIGDLNAGHGCWPPSPALVSSAPTILVNGLNPICMQDIFLVHACPMPPNAHVPQGIATCPNVLFEGKPPCQIGDPTSCGSVIITGSSNVILGT